MSERQRKKLKRRKKVEPEKASTSSLIEDIVEKIEEEEIEEESHLQQLPTGVTLLDLILCGGIPLGRIINIVGDSSSGKTFLTLEILAYLCKLYGENLKWYYDDSEGGFSFDTKNMYGMEVIPEGQEPSGSIEKMGANFNRQVNKLKEGEILVYVVDSLDGLSSDAERKRAQERQKALDEGKDYDKGTYAMEKQKYLSEFFRLKAGEIKNKPVIFIVISQVRCNIGVMFGEKYTVTGGKAMEFYAWARLFLAQSEKLKMKDRVIGACVKARTKKIKGKRPYREGYLDVFFDYGIDNIASNINYLYGLKTPTGKEKKSEKVKWDGLVYTKKALISHIEENDLEDELANRVITKWEEIEQSISIKDKRKSKW